MDILFSTEDGWTDRVSSWEGLIRSLRDNPGFSEQDLPDYKRGVKRRCKMYDGTEIEYSSSRDFVMEMVRVGVIDEILIVN